jgi:hypothetical protein
MLAAFYQSFILVMCPDPNPTIILPVWYSQGGMAKTNPGGPELPDLLEMKGGVLWVLAQ